MKPTPNQLYVYDGVIPLFDKTTPKRLSPKVVRYARNVEVKGVKRVFLILTDEVEIARIDQFFFSAQTMLESGEFSLDMMIFDTAEADPQMLSMSYEGAKT